MAEDGSRFVAQTELFRVQMRHEYGLRLIQQAKCGSSVAFVTDGPLAPPDGSEAVDQAGKPARRVRAVASTSSRAALEIAGGRRGIRPIIRRSERATQSAGTA